MFSTDSVIKNPSNVNIKMGEEQFVDYTTLTTIERLSSSFEGVLEEWGLGIKLDESRTASVSIVKFGKENELKLSLFAKEDVPETFSQLLNAKKDFQETNDIFVEFGFGAYILIEGNDGETDKVTTEDQIAIILGAARSAVQTVGCHLPVFLQIGSPAQNILTGFAHSPSFELSFDTTNLRRLQLRHTHLDGLLKLFKEHIEIPRTVMAMDDIRFSTRFTFSTMKTGGSNDVFPERDVLYTPFGVANMDESAMEIKAISQNRREDAFTENEITNDLTAFIANYWEVSFEFPEHSGLAESALKSIISSDSRDDVRPKRLVTSHTNSNSAASALSSLADGTTAQEMKFTREFAPKDVGKDFFDYWIRYIFNGRDENVEAMYVLSKTSLEEYTLTADSGIHSKAATIESLAGRFAIAMVHARTTFKDDHFDVILWNRFVDKLRECYEDNTLLDMNTEIDFNTCTFYQKLQLLQCCVVAKKKRHEFMNSIGGLKPSTTADEDGFFDAEESLEKKQNDLTVFRVKQLDINQLHHAEIPLYEPVVQERMSMTEEMVQKESAYLQSLTEQERVEAQLAPLLTDMQAFKHANPGCSFEDFVRFFSKNDFDTETNELSERMTIPDNVWSRTWEEAQPVPAFNQSRLFNEAKIAEEVLFDLENATLSQIKKWILPVVVAAYIRFLNPTEFNIDEKEYRNVLKCLQKHHYEDEQSLEQFVELVSRAEHSAAVQFYVKQLFNDNKPVNLKNTSAKEVSFEEMLDRISKSSAMRSLGETPIDDLQILPTSPFGIWVRAVFDSHNEENQISSSRPTIKEYIFHWQVESPSSASSKAPQRMYTKIASGDPSEQRITFVKGLCNTVTIDFDLM